MNVGGDSQVEQILVSTVAVILFACIFYCYDDFIYSFFHSIK
jgi:hypothetical protein